MMHYGNMIGFILADEVWFIIKLLTDSQGFNNGFEGEERTELIDNNK